MEKPIIESAEGLWIHTQDGRDILDAASGTFNLPLGYHRKSIEAAVRAQIEKVSFIPSDLAHPSTLELTSKLLELGKPLGLSSLILRDLTGSTANECAIKIAQAYTGKAGIVSFDRCHHGQTIVTTGISGTDFRKEGISSMRLSYAHRIPVGSDINVLEDEWKRANGDLAAVIIEPVLGNGGNILHPPGYFDVLKQFCEDHHMLLIVDEVQTGIGRVGETLASRAFKIRPDIMTLAKGLGNGYPIAAVMYTPELEVLKRYQHSFTCGTHPASVAAANVTIDEVCNDLFLSSVRMKSKHLETLLLPVQKRFPRVKEVRGMGFMWGLEISDSAGEPDAATTNKIAEIALQQFDLRLRTSQYGFGNVVKVRPALIATEDELAELVQRLEKTLDVAFNG